MTASSSLSPSGPHGLAATLASELSAVGSRPFILLVTQLSWPVGSNPDSSAGKPSPSWGSWLLSLTLFPYHHHPANTPCGCLTGNGTLPHSNIAVSVCPQIKAQSLSWTNLWPMDSEWEVGASIKLAVWVCAPCWSLALSMCPSAPPRQRRWLRCSGSSPWTSESPSFLGPLCLLPASFTIPSTRPLCKGCSEAPVDLSAVCLPTEQVSSEQGHHQTSRAWNRSRQRDTQSIFAELMNMWMNQPFKAVWDVREVLMWLYAMREMSLLVFGRTLCDTWI